MQIIIKCEKDNKKPLFDALKELKYNVHSIPNSIDAQLSESGKVEYVEGKSQLLVRLKSADLQTVLAKVFELESDAQIDVEEQQSD